MAGFFVSWAKSIGNTAWVDVVKIGGGAGGGGCLAGLFGIFLMWLGGDVIAPHNPILGAIIGVAGFFLAVAFIVAIVVAGLFILALVWVVQKGCESGEQLPGIQNVRMIENSTPVYNLPGHYYAAISNVDDSATICTNGVAVVSATWGKGENRASIGHKPGLSDQIDISEFLHSGENILRFQVINGPGCCGTSGTFAVYSGDSVLIERTFSRQDSSPGVKYDESVNLSIKTVTPPRDTNIQKTPTAIDTVLELDTHHPYWTMTSIEVAAGQEVKIEATGQFRWDSSIPKSDVGPDGAGWCAATAGHPEQFLVPSANVVCLLAKVNNQVLPIGSRASFVPINAGRLELGINERWLPGRWDDNYGTITVRVRTVPDPNRISERPTGTPPSRWDISSAFSPHDFQRLVDMRSAVVPEWPHPLGGVPIVVCGQSSPTASGGASSLRPSLVASS